MMQDAPQEEPLLSFPTAQQADASPLPADEAPMPVDQEETQATIPQPDASLPLAEEAQTLSEQPVVETPQPQIASSEQFVLPESLASTSDGELLAIEEATRILTPDSASDEASSADETLPADQQPDPTDASTSLVTPDIHGTGSLAQPAIQPQAPGRKRTKRRAIIALCAVLLLLLSGSAVLFDLGYYQPYQAQVTANAQATGTVNAASTQTANYDATDTAREQATADAYQNIYQKATYGAPFLTDPLSKQSSANWDTYSDPGQDACGFKDGSYHVQGLQTGFFTPCDENSEGFEDFALQVNMTIVSGDYGGIIFRGKDGFFYFIDIDLAGDYYFSEWNYLKSQDATPLGSGSTGYMLSGNSQANQLTLIAEGSTFYLYVNQHYVNTFTDGSYQSGWIGLMVNSVSSPTEAAFSNEKLWLL